MRTWRVSALIRKADSGESIADADGTGVVRGGDDEG